MNTRNFSIGLLPEDIAIFHALYRTSIKGRGDEEVLKEHPAIMQSDLTKEIKKRIDDEFYITNIKYNDDGELLLDTIAKEY